jgi:hypothetical protein
MNLVVVALLSFLTERWYCDVVEGVRVGRVGWCQLGWSVLSGNVLSGVRFVADIGRSSIGESGWWSEVSRWS